MENNVAEADRTKEYEGEAAPDSLERSLAQVVPELDRLQTEHETHLKATKGRFNVFTVLRGAGDEAGLHSRWIAYLLDPKGAHDCGPLFLNLFIKTLQKIGVLKHSNETDPDFLSSLRDFDTAKASMGTEVNFGNGRIDILIDSPGSGIILIENKIWAAEQADQIARYGEYLHQPKYEAYKAKALLYLTLEGSQATTAGDYSSKYRRISYKQHILSWLDDCLRETYQFININQTLQQYRNLVYQLVFRSTPLEKTFMTAALEVIRKNPAVIKHYREIADAIEALRKERYNAFKLEVNNQLQGDGIALSEPTEASYYVYWRVTTIQQGKWTESMLTIFFEKGRFFLGAWGVEAVERLEKDFFAKMSNSMSSRKLTENFSNCTAVVDLPEIFTDKELSIVVANEIEFKERVQGSVEIIGQYVKAATVICPKVMVRTI